MRTITPEVDAPITLANIDSFDINYLTERFRIHTRPVGYERGPEHGEWLAWQEDGPSVKAAFRDEAVVDLVILIEGLDT